MSDEAEEVAEEEEFCCLRRQLKEEVEVDLLGLVMLEVMVEVTSRVGEEVANLLLLFLALMTRLWTTPPDGESSTR